MNQQTVLLVEDDPTVATCLNSMLDCDGHHVLQAQSGADAVSLGRMHRSGIGLILCDVQLPGESGAALAMNLREFCPQARVLFLSGYPLDVLLERRLLDRPPFEEGWAFFLQKPFVISQLRDAIGCALQPSGAGSNTFRGMLRHAATAY